MLRRYFELPEGFYAALVGEDAAVLLESGKPDAEEHRSWLYTKPVTVLRLEPGSDLPAFLEDAERWRREGYHLAGYVAYEAGYALVGLGEAPSPPYPLAQFGVYRRPVAFDHLTGELSGELPGAGRQNGAAIRPELHELRLGIGEADYHAGLERIRTYLEAGDCYQVNFTDAYRFALRGSALRLYQGLKQAQRVSYGAYLRFSDLEVLSLSPELFFNVRGRHITTRPMKGTSRRGRTLAEDEGYMAELTADPKSRAENVMIVDLLRNDLGRVCETGTVRVPRLFEVERYQNLLQMTSTVTGTLRPNLSLADIFAALFPCGSVTGAPKKRVMEIIRELEPEPRGLYTGAIGHIAPDGDAAFNVAIRTLVLQGGCGRLGVGSGIVHDSRPAEEYAECRLKAGFLTESRSEHEPFDLFETLRWERGYPLLARHLARLADSARYFGRPFDAGEARRRLLELGGGLDSGQVYRVRLVLDSEGLLRLEPSPFQGERAGPLRVALAPWPTDSRDRFLYHKTTRRGRYDQAARLAREQGLADLLFVNERGELTEGAISNLFVLQGGRLLTPPVSCGLLPGVYRGHLLDTDPRAGEQVLGPEQLETADALFLCNALRGLRRVVLSTLRSVEASPASL